MNNCFLLIFIPWDKDKNGMTFTPSYSPQSSLVLLSHSFTIKCHIWYGNDVKYKLQNLSWPIIMFGQTNSRIKIRQLSNNGVITGVITGVIGCVIWNKAPLHKKLWFEISIRKWGNHHLNLMAHITSSFSIKATCIFYFGYDANIWC